MLSLNEWMKIYEKISSLLNLSYEEDSRATELLSVLLRNKAVDIETIKNIIKNKHVVVIGAGPTVLEDLESIKKIERKNLVFITCNGATKAFLEVFETNPDIIVTDFDGYPKEQILCNKQGSIIVAHAHGDNKDQIITYIPKLTKVIGSTQVRPFENVYNFGGFTDGDRAVFLSGHFNPKSITLIGMGLTSEVGKYSKPIIFDRTKKLEKLKIAKELLEIFAKKVKEKKLKIRLVNLTKEGVNIEGFRKIKLKEFLEMVY